MIGGGGGGGGGDGEGGRLQRMVRMHGHLTRERGREMQVGWSGKFVT